MMPPKIGGLDRRLYEIFEDHLLRMKTCLCYGEVKQRWEERLAGFGGTLHQSPPLDHLGLIVWRCEGRTFIRDPLQLRFGVWWFGKCRSIEIPNELATKILVLGGLP
jgi:hypothetical protein